MLRRLALTLLLLVLQTLCFGQAVQWIGNSKLFLTGVGQIPSKSSFIESTQTISITTQTWPIAPGQTVTAVVTTNNWLTQQEYVFTYDYAVGNNSQWYLVLGPLAAGTDLQFYIRANGQSSSVVYDNNASQNFGWYTRYAPIPRLGTILQWFETDYKTMLKRLPEVVNAGYSTIYVPAPQKSGGGAYSVGYNPFDRFDLGDRLSLGTVRTKYGTSQELQELISEAKRFDIEVYCDLVLNHSDNRASTAINRYPDTIPEDYHVKSTTDTSNAEINFNTESAFSFGMLNYDLIGLADIAHEDNNNTRTGTFTLPSYASFNAFGKPSFIRHPRTPQYYLNNAPVTEDVRQYLKRWGWFLNSVIGFQGFRFDAVKHMPPGFFDGALGQPGSAVSNGEILPYLYGLDPKLYMFGENYTSGAYELREYAKTGMNLLDFPLKFNMDSLFNSSGFNNLTQALGNGYGLDPATGLAYEYGGLSRDVGVEFVQSHDQGPPYSNNLAHAWIMGRVGRPMVYYDGNNIQPGNYSLFPKPGRSDALGSGGDLLTRLVDAHGRFARGSQVNRLTIDHLFVFERQVNGVSVLLVGLNNRGDNTTLGAPVQTAFPSGTILQDMSGQMPDLTVGATGQVTIAVPSNTDANSTNNARGYVFYAPKTPTILSSNFIDPFESTPIPQVTVSLPNGTYGTAGSFKAATIASNATTISVVCDASAASAYLKLDNGVPIGGLTPATNTSEGLLDGFVTMTKLGNTFNLVPMDLKDLTDGLHVIRVRVLANSSGPTLFTESRLFFYLNREGSYKVDGDLAGIGGALASQGRAPTSQGNRLDILYAGNDDRYLYLSVAGNVDTTESLTNGVAMFLDMDPGASTGVTNFGSLNDDSSPATRLLSNANVTAPSGFGAEYGLGVLRRSRSGTSPESNSVGQPILTPKVGAFAGFYQLNSGQVSNLGRMRASVAWQPRNSTTDPAKGLEAAIPLADIYPVSVTPGTQIGLVTYLCTTGESGTVLPSSDVSRGNYGGFGLPQSYLTNQFLPTQSTVVNDPGVASVALSHSSRFTLRFATPQPMIRVLRTSGDSVPEGYVREKILIVNRSPQAIVGPISLRLTVPTGVQVVNRTGKSLRQPGLPYLTIDSGTIPARGSFSATIDYWYPAGTTGNVSFEAFSGRGIL